MSKKKHDDLNKLIRREKRREAFRGLLLPFLLLVCLIVGMSYLAATRDPLGRTYHWGQVVALTDISSGTGVRYEIVVQFVGLQKVFELDAPEALVVEDDRICIEQSRGVFVGEGVDQARYHALADPSQCPRE